MTMYHVHIYVLYVDLSDVEDEQFKAVGGVYMVWTRRGGGLKGPYSSLLCLDDVLYMYIHMYINMKYFVLNETILEE